MDDIKNILGWGLPKDFNDMLNYTSGNQRTSYEEMLDDLAEDMSQTVTESQWTELLIYLIEAMERKA